MCINLYVAWNAANNRPVIEEESESVGALKSFKSPVNPARQFRRTMRRPHEEVFDLDMHRNSRSEGGNPRQAKSGRSSLTKVPPLRRLGTSTDVC